MTPEKKRTSSQADGPSPCRGVVPADVVSQTSSGHSVSPTGRSNHLARPAPSALTAQSVTTAGLGRGSARHCPRRRIFDANFVAEGRANPHRHRLPLRQLCSLRLENRRPNLPRRQRHLPTPGVSAEANRARRQRRNRSNFIGFRAQDLFFERSDHHDWFLFIEDDIAIRDSCFLEKMSRFNAGVDSDRILVMPHRYELVDGLKTYIDLYDRKAQRPFASDPFGRRIIDGIALEEYANPHVGMYCLDRRQLDRWGKSGRHWHGRVTFVGPLESAATGCLYECFTLYQPVRDQAHFLEVEHLDDKYSRAISQLTAAATD